MLEMWIGLGDQMRGREGKINKYQIYWLLRGIVAAVAVAAAAVAVAAVAAAVFVLLLVVLLLLLLVLPHRQRNKSRIIPHTRATARSICTA